MGIEQRPATPEKRRIQIKAAQNPGALDARKAEFDSRLSSSY